MKKEELNPKEKNDIIKNENIIKRQIHFKNYDLPVSLLREIKTDYIVFSKMNRNKENGLLLTIEINEKKS